MASSHELNICCVPTVLNITAVKLWQGVLLLYGCKEKMDSCSRVVAETFRLFHGRAATCSPREDGGAAGPLPPLPRSIPSSAINDNDQLDITVVDVCQANGESTFSELPCWLLRRETEATKRQKNTHH